jgi:hypothetical protein
VVYWPATVGSPSGKRSRALQEKLRLATNRPLCQLGSARNPADDAMNSIKAVIFDMDGVLIDAKDWHFDALNRALGHFGFQISRQDHCQPSTDCRRRRSCRC